MISPKLAEIESQSESGNVVTSTSQSESGSTVIWKVGICYITYILCYVPPLLRNKTMQHL